MDDYNRLREIIRGCTEQEASQFGSKINVMVSMTVKRHTRRVLTAAKHPSPPIRARMPSTSSDGIATLSPCRVSDSSNRSSDLRRPSGTEVIDLPRQGVEPDQCRRRIVGFLLESQLYSQSERQEGEILQGAAKRTAREDPREDKYQELRKAAGSVYC